MADEHDRPVLGAELAHLLERLALEARVADRQRLVDQQDVRVHVHGDREPEPPVHARRVRVHRHVHEVLELGELHDLVVLLLEVIARDAGGQAAEDHVLAAAEVAVEAHAEREQRANAAVDLDPP